MEANYAIGALLFFHLLHPYNESRLNRFLLAAIIHRYAVVMVKWGELYFDQLKWKHLKGYLASRWDYYSFSSFMLCLQCYFIHNQISRLFDLVGMFCFSAVG